MFPGKYNEASRLNIYCSTSVEHDCLKRYTIDVVKKSRDKTVDHKCVVETFERLCHVYQRNAYISCYLIMILTYSIVLFIAK